MLFPEQLGHTTNLGGIGFSFMTVMAAKASQIVCRSGADQEQSVNSKVESSLLTCSRSSLS